MKDNKKYNFAQPLILACVLAVGIWMGGALVGEKTKIVFKEKEHNEQIKLGRVDEIIKYISAKYVDSIDAEKLSTDAINAIFGHLDPHSFFIQRANVQEINEHMSGSYIGLGISFEKIDDTVYVSSLIKDGPSYNSGMEIGDIIFSINGDTVSGNDKNATYIQDLIKDSESKYINLNIQNICDNSNRTIRVKKGKVPTHSVNHTFLLNNNTAYIKLSEFNAHTTQEFIDSLYKLNAQNNNYNLILDLRGNPGGYLTHAINILSQIIKERDMLVVYTQGNKTGRREYKTSGRAFFNFDDIYILMDELSASASEIVAGALQDYDLAKIVGRRSFGKGLVQDQFELSDGSAIRLTVSRYYTPSGRLIQRPYDGDYEKNYAYSFNNRWNSGELFTEENIPTGDTVVYCTRGGREVPGGIGIVPDVFVPLDSMLYDESIIEAFQILKPGIIRLANCEFSELEDPTTINILEYIEEFEPYRYKQMISYLNEKNVKLSQMSEILSRKLNLLFIHETGNKVFEESYRLSTDPFINTVLQLEKEQELSSNESIIK